MAERASLRKAGVAFKVRLWGRFAVRRASDGAELTPRGRKARALIAYLLIEGEPVARERLAGLLWSERGQAQAHASLRQCLLELRDLAPLFDAERHQVGIAAGAAGTDLAAVEAVARQGEAGELGALLASGTALLEGMDGIDPAFDQWLRTTRAVRTQALLADARRCCEAALAGGEAEAAVGLAAALQGIDPLDEALARLAMEANHKFGKQDQVRRIYERLANDLRAELGVAPSATTRALHDRLAPASAPAPPRRRGEAPETVHGDEPRLAADPKAAASPEASGMPRRRRFRGAALVFAVLGLIAVAALWLGATPDAAPIVGKQRLITGQPADSIGRVLWVDDHPENNAEERRFLEQRKIAVSQVTGGEDALELLAMYSFGAVISDMDRNDRPLAGLKLVREMRRRGDRTPFFIYTVMSSAAQRRLIADAGGQGAMVTSDELYAAILPLFSQGRTQGRSESDRGRPARTLPPPRQ